MLLCAKDRWCYGLVSGEQKPQASTRTRIVCEECVDGNDGKYNGILILQMIMLTKT